MTKLEKRDLLLKEWEQLGGERAGKGILKKLSDKYQVPDSTVRRWKSEYIKKRMNVHKKTNERIQKLNSKKIQIKQDILEGKSKDEIMENYGIGKSTYYNNANSIRQMRLEKTEEYLGSLLDEVYPDLEDLLKILERTKRSSVLLAIREMREQNYNKVKDIKKAYDCLKSMENELIRTGKMLTHYEILEIERELFKENGVIDLKTPIFIEDIEE